MPFRIQTCHVGLFSPSVRLDTTPEQLDAWKSEFCEKLSSNINVHFDRTLLRTITHEDLSVSVAHERSHSCPTHAHSVCIPSPSMRSSYRALQPREIYEINVQTLHHSDNVRQT